MTAINNTNIPKIGSSHLPMAVYDTLPPAVRKALQDAPFNLSINLMKMKEIIDDNGKSVHQLYDLFQRLIRDSAIATYGPNHPQAQ